MSDYTPRHWVEGEKGTAADLNHIEEGLDIAQEEAEGGAKVNVRKYGVKLTATPLENITGINAAVAGLPSTGGTVFFPERGIYIYAVAGKAEPINVQEKSGVVFQGQGGVSAGGGLGYPKGGVPAVNFPPTSLAYAGTGAAAVNAKKTTGTGFVDIEIYAYKKVFGEANGYVVDLSESNFPFMTNTTIECSGEAGETIQAKCVLLANTNCGNFTRAWIKGGKEGVIGRRPGEALDYSYNHTFVGGGFVGQSGKSVINIHNGWGFYGSAFEPHYSSAGVETGAGGGWIGYSGVGLESIGTVISQCFFGATPGKEAGTAIEWYGKSLLITGGEIACAENAIVIPVKSENITLTPHINLCKIGLVISATNANEVSKLEYRPSLGETNAKGAITPYFFSAGKPRSARLITTVGEEWKALAELVPATATAKECAEKINAMLKVMKSLGEIE